MTRLNSVATAIAAAALLASSFVSADHHGGAHASSINNIDSNNFGIDAKEIADIKAQMQAAVDGGFIAGNILLVGNSEGVGVLETAGTQGPGQSTPMDEQTLFRIYSMTKPIVSVATMTLVEDGLLAISDPVSKYIPEFADMQVAVLKDSIDENISPYSVNSQAIPEHRLVPAQREITIHDLLTHTSGLASGGLGTAASERPQRDGDSTLASIIPQYGSYALDFQPGARWTYSPGVGLDVVSHILEIVSGKPFDEIIDERILQPLGMDNTYFNVPAEYKSRRVDIEDQDMSRFLDRPPTKYFSASGGLTSSAEDYLRFEQMLLNGGELFGNRLLSPRSVRMMSSNQIGGLYKSFSRQQEGMGFGYTVAVTLDPITSNARRSAGAFGWGGAFGTRSWTDPEEELTAVIMLQQAYGPAQYDFENAVQQAIID